MSYKNLRLTSDKLELSVVKLSLSSQNILWHLMRLLKSLSLSRLQGERRGGHSQAGHGRLPEHVVRAGAGARQGARGRRAARHQVIIN